MLLNVGPMPSGEIAPEQASLSRFMVSSSQKVVPRVPCHKRTVFRESWAGSPGGMVRVLLLTLR